MLVFYFNPKATPIAARVRKKKTVVLLGLLDSGFDSRLSKWSMDRSAYKSVDAEGRTGKRFPAEEASQLFCSPALRSRPNAVKLSLTEPSTG